MESTNESTVLRCESCGNLTDHLIATKQPVRSLSLGRELGAGTLICRHCYLELQEELTEEETLRGPA
jgi:hypothetical protein